MKRRDSARAILLDEDDQVLLLEYEDDAPVDPANPTLLRYWLTPGGGLEDGEGYDAALRRELSEELGVTAVDVGPLVGVRDVVLDLPGRGLVNSHEEYYACRVAEPFRLSHDGLSPNEQRVFRDARWWSLDALARRNPVVRPPALADLVRAAASGPHPDVIRLD